MRHWPLTIALFLGLTACWTQAPTPYVSTETDPANPPHLYQGSPERVYGHVLRLAQDKPEWQLLTDARQGEGFLATFHIATDPLKGHDEVRFIVTPDSYGVSSVAMMSRSRERSQDFKANNRRVRTFFKELDSVLPIATSPVVPPPPKPRDALAEQDYPDYVPIEPYKSPTKVALPEDAPNQDTAVEIDSRRTQPITPQGMP